MTPTRKGNYPQCSDCSHKMHGNETKYPCSYSHKEVRISSGEKLERNFQTCGLYSKSNPQKESNV